MTTQLNWKKINAKLALLQKEQVKLAHANKDYTALADQIDLLGDQKQELLVAKAETEGFKNRIKDLQKFLDGSEQELTEYDEMMVRKYIDRILIF